MPRLRLSYTRFADLAAGQVGEPGEGYLVSPARDFFVHVRREDPSELLAFEIEHFSEAFAEGRRDALAPLLGSPVMGQLVNLWELVPTEPQPLIAVSDDEFDHAVREGRLEFTTTIPEADEITRAARIHLLDEVDAWSGGKEEAVDAPPLVTRVNPSLVMLGSVGDALRAAVEKVIGAGGAFAGEVLVLGARLLPAPVRPMMVFRGPFRGSRGSDSKLVLSAEALAVVGDEAQTQVTISSGSLQVSLSGLSRLHGGEAVRLIALTRAGEIVIADGVAEGVPLRITLQIEWPDADPPGEIALTIREAGP